MPPAPSSATIGAGAAMRFQQLAIPSPDHTAGTQRVIISPLARCDRVVARSRCGRGRRLGVDLVQPAAGRGIDCLDATDRSYAMSKTNVPVLWIRSATGPGSTSLMTPASVVNTCGPEGPVPTARRLGTARGLGNVFHTPARYVPDIHNPTVRRTACRRRPSRSRYTYVASNGGERGSARGVRLVQQLVAVVLDVHVATTAGHGAGAKPGHVDRMTTAGDDEGIADCAAGCDRRCPFESL